MNTPALPHSITIPVTLRDLLVARLDRYMIAQIGAAIGREFSYELIAAVAPRAKAFERKKPNLNFFAPRTRQGGVSQNLNF